MRSMRDLWPEAPSIVILTGAGISQESRLATFRDADGIWASVRLEEVATPEVLRAIRRACWPSTTRAGDNCSTPRSHSASLFAERIYGKASRIVPEYVAKLLNR